MRQMGFGAVVVGLAVAVFLLVRQDRRLAAELNLARSEVATATNEIAGVREVLRQLRAELRAGRLVPSRAGEREGAKKSEGATSESSRSEEAPARAGALSDAAAPGLGNYGLTTLLKTEAEQEQAVLEAEARMFKLARNFNVTVETWT
jgi:hypothetical protein